MLPSPTADKPCPALATTSDIDFKHFKDTHSHLQHSLSDNARDHSSRQSSIQARLTQRADENSSLGSSISHYIKLTKTP